MWLLGAILVFILGVFFGRLSKQCPDKPAVKFKAEFGPERDINPKEKRHAPDSSR